MQCVNCGFENIPGMEQCVRCQSSLALATVDVVPPRAGRRRMGSRLRRLWNPVYRGMGTSVRFLRERTVRWLPDVSAYQIPWRALGRSIVIPGLGHIRYGNRVLGWVLLGGWLYCFPAMLLTIGSTWDWTFVALAILIHTAAVLSFLGEQLMESYPIARGAFGILLFAGLWMGVYRPAGALLSRFYTPFPIEGILANSVVADGDALLYQGPWLRPDTFRRGELVIYRISRGAFGRYGYRAEGYGLDRILGVPGDAVTIDGGKIVVNGKPVGPREVPIGAVPSGHYEMHVGEGQYMIVPSAVLLWARGIDPGRAIVDMSLVSRDDVLGRVVLRINPLGRFGSVR